jgi:hypothetical protein
LIYAQLIDLKQTELIAKVAHREEEASQLIETEFESALGYRSNKIFKKRKQPLTGFL